MDYHIRLSKEFSILEPFWLNLQKECEAVVVYEHVKDEEVNRTHVHALVKRCQSKTTTLKARLVKLFGAWKKEDWAFMEAKNDNLITYMSKGTLDPVFCSGFLTEYIQSLKSDWIEPSHKAVKKPTYDNICKIISQRLPIQPDGYTNNLECLHIIIEVLNEHNIVCGRYKIRDIYDTVRRTRNPINFVNDMFGMLAYPQKLSQ